MFPPQGQDAKNSAKSLSATSTARAKLPFEIPSLEFVGLAPVVQTALTHAEQAVLSNPSDSSKVGELGMYYFNAGCPLAAASCFRYASKLEPGAMRWQYYLGLAFKDAYNTSESIKAFEAAQKLDPQYAPVQAELGGMIVKTDPAAAEELFKKAEQLNPKEPRVYFGLGECARLRGDHEEAIRQYRKALALAPGYSDVHQSMTQSLKALGRESEASLHRNVRSTGRSPVTREDPLLLDLLRRATAGRQLFDLASALTEAGQVVQAIETLQAALEKDDTDPSARAALGLLYGMTGQKQEAVIQFRAVLNRRPNDFQSVLNLAGALTNAGEYAEAEPLYVEALNREANNRRAISLYSRHLLLQGQREEARQYFEKLVQLNPNDPEGLFESAVALVCLQQNEAAVNQYKRVTAMRPDSTNTFEVFLSAILGVMKDQHRTATPEQNTLTAPPSTLNGLADVLDANGLKSEAGQARAYRDLLIRRAVAEARSNQHSDAMSFIRLGLADEGKKGDSDTIARLRKVLHEAPKDSAVEHLLAMVLLDIGDATGAKNEWGSLVKENPKYEPAYIGWAIEMIREGAYSDARRIMEDGLRETPDSPWLANALAWVLATSPDAAQRDGPRAVELATKACAATNHKNHVLLDTLAAAHAAAGDFAKAERLEQEAMRIADDVGQKAAVAVYRGRMDLYENQQPYVQSRGQHP